MSYNLDTHTYKGLDVPINSLKSIFTSKLFTAFEYVAYGQTYIINDENIPYAFNSNKDYIEVLGNDKKDAISFFYANPETSEFDGDYYSVDVGIYFYVNLSVIKSDKTTYRAIEDVITDVYKIIMPTEFEIIGRIVGLKAFSEFNIDRIKETDMQPFALFKFNTIINYKMQ